MTAPQSRAVVCFAAASYLCAGLSFSYVHRYAGTFGMESLLWTLWTLVGFGGALWHVGRGPEAGRMQWKVQVGIGLALAVFPFFFMFNLVRWVALVLMLVIGARAAIMHTRRDFRLTLMVVFVVSFLVATHSGADWTLWFYIGPCWLFAAMALAWDHAAGARLPTHAKGLLTAGFVLLSLMLALLLHAWVPKPNIMGFGFLPPGTDHVGHFKTPSATSDPKQGDEREGDAGSGTTGDENGGTTAPDGGRQAWGQELQQLRQTLADRHIPAWQRATLGVAIDSLNALAKGLGGTSAAARQYIGSLSLVGMLLWLLALLLALWVWRRRWLLGAKSALLVAGGLTSWRPALSMRLSAAAASWALRSHGHRPGPGHSIREHWGGLVNAPMLSLWLQSAAETYCASRFGALGATPPRARELHLTLTRVCGLLWSGPKPPPRA